MAKLTIQLETTQVDRRRLNNILAHVEKDIFNFIVSRTEDSVKILGSRYGADYKMNIEVEQDGDHINKHIDT